MRIITLNANGIRAAAKKGFYPWLEQQAADIICIQELKAQLADLSDEILNPPGWHGVFHCAEKKGYSGVAIYSRQAAQQVVEGVGIAEVDSEGRYVRADFGGLSVVSLYLPSGSHSPERQAVKFRFMEWFSPILRELATCGREVIICGDWNIAHQAIDLKNWRGNQKNSGFLPEERAWLDQLLVKEGWCDVYRRLYPEATESAYTWWSQRGQAWAKNVGWRIDYQIATSGVAATARRASVYKDERFSDHAPLIVDYEYNL
jgi:exodeoxyribonuclease-3